MPNPSWAQHVQVSPISLPLPHLVDGAWFATLELLHLMLCLTDPGT